MSNCQNNTKGLNTMTDIIGVVVEMTEKKLLKEQEKIPDTKKGIKIKKQIQRGFDVANKWKAEDNNKCEICNCKESDHKIIKEDNKKKLICKNCGQCSEVQQESD